MISNHVSTDSQGLIVPKKLVNPCLESMERQNLHREMLFNQKIGKPVLNQKSELQRALEKQKERHVMAAQQESKQNSLGGELEKVIMERAQRLEGKTKDTNYDKNENEQLNDEYLKARNRLQKISDLKKYTIRSKYNSKQATQKQYRSNTFSNMHIENPEALKIWLTVVLEPLCDADPSALARYVLALLKKEKPQKELLTCMAEQLDVFLGGETSQFLTRLFDVIKSQEYIGTKIASEAPLDVLALPITIKKDSTPPLIAVSPKETSIKPEKVSPAASDISMKSVNKSKSQEPTSKLLLDAKGVLEPRKRRNSNRSRSRSRSNERLRRSRSRDRRPNEYGRDKNARQYRNSSPPTSGGRRLVYDQHRKNERMSPKSYANRQVPGGRHRSKSQSRSRSNSPDYARRGASPKHDNDPSKLRKRCRDFNEKGYCMRGETCPWDHGVDPVVLEDINNPAMLGMPARPPIHSEYNPDAPDLWNRGGPNYGPRMMHGQGMPMPVPRPPGFGFRGPPFPFQMGPGGATAPLPRELIPVPVLDGGQGGDASNQVKRRFEPEDSVAIAEGPQKRKVLMNSRLGPRIGHHNGQMMAPGVPGQNCSLELRKVPRGLNAISHLNNHFSKFGKIVNIQISYDNDPEAAIVTFSAHAEANVAYRSTEAVLNNRFIKVFWHTGAGSENNNGNSGSSTIPSKSEMSLRNSRSYQNPYQTINNNTTQQATVDGANTVSSSSGVQQATTSESTEGAPTTPVTTHTPTTNASLATIQMNNLSKIKTAKFNRATSELIRKKQEEQVKNAVNLSQDLNKRKNDLLTGYFKQMKSVLDLISKLDQADPQRAKLMNTVKGLQVTIEELKKQIEKDGEDIALKMRTQAPVRLTKEQQQKEILDVELELISQEHLGDGTDVAPIKKRLQDLQRSLKAPGFVGTAPVGVRPRPTPVRLAPPGSTSVDRRPTTILITGFALEDSDALMGHFKHFGEITKNDMDQNVPSLTLTYANRIIAEQAISRGKQFKEKPLNIIWYSPSVPADNNNDTLKNENASPNKSSVPSDSEDIKDLSDKRAELPLDEEDEDIESEDRSWRR